MADKLDRIIENDVEDNIIKKISEEELEKVTGGYVQGSVSGGEKKVIPVLRRMSI